MMVRGSDGNLKFNVLSGDLDSLPQIDMTGEVTSSKDRTIK